MKTVGEILTMLSSRSNYANLEKVLLSTTDHIIDSLTIFKVGPYGLIRFLPLCGSYRKVMVGDKNVLMSGEVSVDVSAEINFWLDGGRLYCIPESCLFNSIIDMERRDEFVLIENSMTLKAFGDFIISQVVAEKLK